METQTTATVLWDPESTTEYADSSSDSDFETMPEPSVNVLDLMIGLRRRDAHGSGASYLDAQIPPDLETIVVSRTTGQSRVVEELVVLFTHSVRMDWLLPGVAPTWKHVEIPIAAVVQFDGDEVVHEHIYWDQASVLTQVGLLSSSLPDFGGGEEVSLNETP